MTSETTRFGIIAPGNIAEKFADAIKHTPGAELYGVASRSSERARSFAKRHNAKKVFSNYEELIQEPDIDIIYIASPHHLHAAQSLMCLNGRKAVICEKPMTVNIKEAREVIDTARANQVFYTEAVWTRFMPIYKQIRGWIDDGAIGNIKLIKASFGFAMQHGPEHRINNPHLAGGALLDLGIYPLTFVDWVQGREPMRIQSAMHPASTGVDESISMQLTYSDGVIASALSSSESLLENKAWIFGTEGNIEVPLFWCADSATLNLRSGESQTVALPHEVNGYEWEIKECHRCLQSKLTQSPLMPWDTSLRLMAIMDSVRDQIGLKYPFE